MKIIKELLKKLIVYIVLFMIIMSSIVPPKVFAEVKEYTESNGSFLIEQVQNYYDTWLAKKEDGKDTVVIDSNVRTPYWSEGLEGEGEWHVNSSAGVIWAYMNFLNCNLTSYGFSYNLQNIYTEIKDNKNIVEKDGYKIYKNNFYVTGNTKKGNIIIGKIDNNQYTVELCMGSSTFIDFGTKDNMIHLSGNRDKAFEDSIILQPTSEVLVEQSASVSSNSRKNAKKEAKKSVNIGTSKFFFNGIPDGKYSLATKEGLFSTLINNFGELIDFLAGLMTYLLRGVIISIISLFDRLLNNTIKSINDSPKSLQETGVSPTSADDPTSDNRPVTIEGLVFDNIDIFDVNIFNIDED